MRAAGPADCVLNGARTQSKIEAFRDESNESAPARTFRAGQNAVDGDREGLWTMRFATAVGPEIERPRDAPNAPADRQALTLVKSYQGMVAWPTVALAFGILCAFILVIVLATMGIIPLCLGLILNTLILYADQTPLHEACHGNIAGKDSRYLFINHTVGYVCGTLLLHEYKAFRYMHLAHHRDTNNEEIDPDHWVAVEGPFKVLWRCLTIVFWYHQYFWRHIAFHAHIPGMRPLTIHIACM